MPSKPYTASLSQSQGRPGWSIIFRHPVRSDESPGKGGLRVRQGLGTADVAEAERLREQMNELLADSRYWQPSARLEAEKRFDRKVVDIFYYKMEPEETDYFGVREALIPLPSSGDSDYRRALFLGTTGAGKTTLLRQILGTDPERERFPSTSTAKTTVHDTEVVLADGAYRAAVTFFPLDEVREYLSECLSNAVLGAYRGDPDPEVLRRMLAHVNQRFRFSYILGNGPALGESADDEDDDLDAGEPVLETQPVDTAVDLAATNAVLSTGVTSVKDLARRLGDELRLELGPVDEADQRVVDELFEEELDRRLRGDDAFHELVDRLLDEVEKRFDLLTAGTLRRTKQGWPLLWHFETDDRAAFIRAVSRFSSNHAPWFGTLLTPLVNGVRVAGPFQPAWQPEARPNLVIFDGEGLGHTPRSVATISTSVSRRIDAVDAVVLVDNATQPMQAAPVAAMRELVATGNAGKLIFVFSHFDLVKGDNLPSASAREQHVLASAENVLAAVGEDLGPYAERALRQRLVAHRFFVSGIDQVLDTSTKAGRRTAAQLKKLLEAIGATVERPAPVVLKPVYDRMNLVLAVKQAAESFHDAWWPRLGLEIKPGLVKEHWTRVKALSRRLATPGWADEYDTLKPVADLRKQLQDRLFVLLQNPVTWKPSEPSSDDEKQQVFEALAKGLSQRVLDLASRRIRAERVAQWQDAYNESGSGSSFRRARIIADGVYARAAPVPDVLPSPERNSFLHEVAEAVATVTRECGAVLH